MWKLIKMDFYRLFTSKAIKVGAIMACLLCGGHVLLSLGVIELAKFAIETDPEVYESMQGLSMFLPQLAWLSGVDFAEVVFGGTGFFALFIGCMITASFIGSEQACGFTKNFAGQLPNKGYMVISKFTVTSIALIIILAIYVIVGSLLTMVLLGNYVSGYDINSLIAALGLRLMLHLAINAIIIFICTLTKSHSIAMVAGCIFGIGVTKIVYTVAELILGLLKVNFPIGSYMPDGVNSQLAIDTVGEVYIKALVVSVVFIVAFLAANYFVVRKRDVK